MSKKMFFLISFVLVLVLAGNVLAYDIMLWDNDLGGGDRLWTTSTNWDWTEAGRPGKIPNDSAWVLIDLYADDANGPIIRRGMDVPGGEWLGMGYWDPPTDEVVFTMTGGTLTVGDWMGSGCYYPGIYRFEISGGTIDVGGVGLAEGLSMGCYCRYCDVNDVNEYNNNTLNMSGGTINTTFLEIGGYDANQGDMNMTGGTVNVSVVFYIGAFDWAGFPGDEVGKGHVALHGGTITAASFNMNQNGLGEATMDIANDGTLIINQDLRLPNDTLFDPCSDTPYGTCTGTIAILAKRGLITAYNTQVGDIITDGNYPVGLRAVVNLDYDVPSAGWTTMTARALDPNLAWDPDPLDGTGDINSPAVALTLSWLPGENAASHEVYFGTSQADVEDANTATAVIYRGSGSVVGPDGNDRYSYVIPGGDLPLVFGKSYFWRIDEVNSANTWKGDVWSFDVEGKARIVYPADGAVEIPFQNLTLLWAAGVDANSHDVYFGSDEAAVEDANTNTSGVFRGNQPDVNDPNYAVPEDLDFLQSYYWRIDEVNTISGTFAKGHVWSFTTAPARATNPSPEDGAKDVSPYVVLSWDPGPEADEHHVYFSSDFDDVNDRDPSVRTVRGPNNYTPGLIELDARYYWAVDEVNNLEEPNVWPGKVWDFRTAEYLTVDNFELYVNTGTLNDTWHDWVTASGGTGQYNAEVVYEPDTVHEGGTSMLYGYHNQDYPGFSESWAYASELGAGTDWTAGGVKALRLYFYGDPGNSGDPVYDRMWVGLEDGSGTFALVNCDDMNDVKEPEWHKWNIRVQDFNDINNVDLTDVSKIYIGFGDRAAQGEDGTEGLVIFDDIQIWPPWCRPEKVAADISGDCITDYADVEIMAADWLWLSDSNHTATSPAVAPQIWYTFDEGSGDTITNDGNLGATHNGIFTGDPNDPTWTTDAHDGNALNFDGVNGPDGDYIVIPGNLYSGLSNTVTITAWIKLIVAPGPYPGIVFHRHLECAQQAGLHLGPGGEGNVRYTWANLSATYGWESGLHVPTGQWTFVAVAVGPEEAKLYMSDGVTLNFATNYVSHEAKEFTCTTLVGWDSSYDDRHFRGLIDEVRIYDKTLGLGEMMYLAGVAGSIYVPVDSPANITDPEPKLSRKVNFRDYAIVAEHWLEGPTLWP